MARIKVQDKMLAILEDGLPHTEAELYACLWDDQAVGSTAVAVHICLLRKAIRSKGLGIMNERGERGGTYRLVRFIQRDD